MTVLPSGSRISAKRPGARRALEPLAQLEILDERTVAKIAERGEDVGANELALVAVVQRYRTRLRSPAAATITSPAS